MATLDSDSNILINLETAGANTGWLLSSAKLQRDGGATNRKRSFINRLKIVGHKMDPYETPRIIISSWLLLKRTNSLRLIRYE